MTVPLTYTPAYHAGNGVTTTFPFTFRILEASNLEVITVDADGTETEISTFTVTGVGSYTGGNVILPAPLTDGWHISIKRRTGRDQGTEFRGQGAFFEEIHEDAFDKLTMIQQEQQEQIDRAFIAPKTGGPYDVQLPTPEAGYALGWDATGTKLVNVPNTGADQRADLANTTDPLKGAGQIGYNHTLAGTYESGTVGESLGGCVSGFTNLASSSGSSLVGFIQSGTGAVARTVRDKERDKKDPRDYGLWDGTTTDLAAILACITATAEGGTVEIPDGDINLGTGLVIPKALTLKLGSGDYTASANPVISWAVRGVHLEGSGAHQLSLATNIIAATAAGNAIAATGNTSYDLGSIADINVIGNATADRGVYLQGEAKGWFTLRNVWVEGFTKATGQGVGLYGAITSQVSNCTCSDNHFGLYMSKSGVTTSNLNKFDSCNFVANVQNIYIGDACHANLFHNCNIAQATSAPSVYVEYGRLTTFDNCYFEANAAGTCVVQVGHSTNDGVMANKTVVRSSYIVESSVITSFMHVYNGQACGVEDCSLASNNNVTNLVYFDNPNSNLGYVANNYGNYPSTQVAGPRLAYAMWLGRDASDIYKNTSGSGRIEFGVPFSPKQCTVAQFGTGGIAPNLAGTVVYATNGRKPGEGAGSGTGVLAVYTNGAYRDIGSGTYAVVAS